MPLVDWSRFSLRLTFRSQNLRLIPVNKYLIVHNPNQVSLRSILSDKFHGRLSFLFLLYLKLARGCWISHYEDQRERKLAGLIEYPCIYSQNARRIRVCFALLLFPRWIFSIFQILTQLPVRPTAVQNVGRQSTNLHRVRYFKKINRRMHSRPFVAQRDDYSRWWKIPSVSELSVKMAINQAVIISSEHLSSGRRLVCLEKHIVVRSCGSLDRGG